jgi:hypothetical protein
MEVLQTSYEKNFSLTKEEIASKLDKFLLKGINASGSQVVVHIFTGERKRAKKPADAPAWMSAKIWKPNVEKAVTKKLVKL